MKNNIPDIEKFKKVLEGGKFDHNLLSDNRNPDNNRRKHVREEENHHGGLHSKKPRHSAQDLNLAALIRSKQQQIAAAVRNTADSEHVDHGILHADPLSMSGESLLTFLHLVHAAEKEIKAGEEAESKESLLENLLNKCKNFFSRKHCHGDKAAIASPVADPALNKALNNAIKNVAAQQLGQLTPLMLRNVDNIDPGFVVDPDNQKRRKPQASVMI